MIEADRGLAAGIKIHHLDGAGSRIDTDHLVPHPDVHTTGAVLRRGASDQHVPVRHHAGHPVGDPTRRVRREPAALERQDLQGVHVATPAGLGCRSHPCGVTADHHKPFTHHRTPVHG